MSEAQRSPAAARGTDQETAPVFAERRVFSASPRAAGRAFSRPSSWESSCSRRGEWVVWYKKIPPISSGRTVIFQTLLTDWETLSVALGITLRITFAALIAAVTVGGALAILFTQSKWLERSLFPYAVILQVTPVWRLRPHHHPRG